MRPLRWFSRFCRSEQSAVFVVFLAIYLITLFPGPGGRYNAGDSAKFQYLGEILGVSHAPGAPLYVLLTAAWVRLFGFLSAAVAVNLFSAVCGAAAIAFLWSILRVRLGAGRGASLFSVVVVGSSAAFWTFSTEAELYSLLALTWMATIERLLSWRSTQRSLDLLIAWGFFSCGLGNHYLMIASLPALVLMAGRAGIGTLRSARTALAFGLVSILAVVPLVWLWMRLKSAPYSEYGSGTPSFRGFVDFILASKYRENFGGGLHGILLERPSWATSLLVQQAGLAPLCLVPVGLAAALRRSGRLLWFLILALVCPFLFLVLYKVDDPLGYANVVMCSCGIPVGLAVDSILRYVSQKRYRVMLGILGAVAVLPYASMNAAAVAAPRSLLTGELDGEKNYRWCLPCAIENGEVGAAVVPPWHDYGTRQMVNYYRFTLAAWRAKRMKIAYLDAPNRDWLWAEPRVALSPGTTRLVYVYSRRHAEIIGAAGYRVEQRSLRLVDGRAMQYWRGEGRSR